ncbi:MAG TPA: sugar phosphate isomerase/epimerase [Gemmataceae bacterium]|jgi:sugar phosphate isomerase/epimerase|nr:sugar phosphate isomerase/epimerase [Gemmataceae bacterium]
MTERITRRALLAGATVALAAEAKAVQPAKTAAPFGYCLNTSTIRLAEGQWGKPRPIAESIEIATKAGYQAIEPWISELDEYVQGGGTLKELGKRFTDTGLTVPDAIGFAEWVVDDEARRKRGLETAKRDMDKVQQIGGKRLAAPPVGATGGGSRRDDPKASQPVTNLLAAADRYRNLLELGQAMGVTPLVEVWGHSKTLGRLGETWLVAAECGREGGALLPDVYHLYKGGSDFAGLKLLGPDAIGIFHVNDYPKIDRPKIVDQDRVFPGDGVAPLGDVFRTLREIGYRGYLSLELFNREYWKRDPLEVAREALRKLKDQVAKAVGT